MTILQLLLNTESVVTPACKSQGLLLVARLGRYGQEHERKAAFLLPAVRAGLLDVTGCGTMVCDDCHTLLTMLTSGSPVIQARNICEALDISAGRVLYVELCQQLYEMRPKKPASLKQALRMLQRGLPYEARCELKTGILTDSDVRALFTPQHKIVNYL